jgi:hypothetical protein
MRGDALNNEPNSSENEPQARQCKYGRQKGNVASNIVMKKKVVQFYLPK